MNVLDSFKLDGKVAVVTGGSIINIGSYMGILGPDYNLYKSTDMCKDGAAGDYFFHKGGITITPVSLRAITVRHRFALTA